MNATGIAAASLPGGHVEGFGDTFHALFREVYRAILAGRPPAAIRSTPPSRTATTRWSSAMPSRSSAREGRWVDVA